MSDKVKVYMSMDQMWIFFPQEYGEWSYIDEYIDDGRCVEIDKALLERYRAWVEESRFLNDVFEELYKQQNRK